jgi:hypothetical protein
VQLDVEGDVLVDASPGPARGDGGGQAAEDRCDGTEDTEGAPGDVNGRLDLSDDGSPDEDG